MREKREKAIKFFQDMQECTYGNLEEVDMAIHALKQERNVIEELEKIKEEAEENSFKKYNINNEFKCFAIELPILNSIINDHIEELKGENKE